MSCYASLQEGRSYHIMRKIFVRSRTKARSTKRKEKGDRPRVTVTSYLEFEPMLVLRGGGWMRDRENSSSRTSSDNRTRGSLFLWGL